MNVVAFDLGGSGGKMFLCSFNGDKLDIKTIHKFQNYPIELQGGLYWNFLGIFDNLKTGVQKALKATSEPIVSIGMDSFCNDFSFINKQGELLSPVRCYRDLRTKRYEKQINAWIAPKDLHTITGNQYALFNTYMQLAAMKAAEQDYIYKKAYKMMFLPDLLTYYLTGNVVNEYTVSSVSQLYNIGEHTLSTRIAGVLGLDAGLFGETVRPGTISGSMTSQFCHDVGCSPMEVVSVCEHDTASAFAASVADEDTVIISSGTWSLVGLLSRETYINDYAYEQNIAHEGGHDGYYRILKNVMGLWILQELVRDLKRNGVEYDFALIEQMAQSAPSEGFVIDVDSYEFFAPGDMHAKINAACLATYAKAPSTHAALFRCVYESLAHKYKQAVQSLQTLTGKTITAINVIGGGCKDAFMCQLISDLCNLPVMAGPADATAIGNILLQLHAHKEIAYSDFKEVVRNSVDIKCYGDR